MSDALERLIAGYYNTNLMSVANPGGLSGAGAMRKNWPLLLADLAAVASGAAAHAETAEAQATTAVMAPGTQATSVSNVAIGTGAKTFMVQAGKAIVKGMPAISAATAAPTTSFMFGFVSAYNSVTGQLDLDVKGVGPVGGAFNSWQISLCGPPLNMTTDTFDVTQQLRLSGDITPPQIAATQHDYNPAGLETAAVVRLSSDAAARLITGIAGGAEGRVLTLHNVGGHVMNLEGENAGSVAANRFGHTGTFRLHPGYSVVVLYDHIAARWRIVGAFGFANSTEIWSANAYDRFLSPKAILDAAVFQALADGATITPNFAAGRNFEIAPALGGNRTLANPSNVAVGQGGIIKVPQDATGGRQLAFGSSWKRQGGAPTMTGTPNAVDYIVYYVVAPAVILYALIANPS